MGKRSRSRGLSFDELCQLGATLPGVERGTSYGTPALRVRGKFLARLKEDAETLVLRTSFVVRDHLLRTAPDVFFITDHYRDYPSVLVHLKAADPSVIQQLLEDAWRTAAPKRVVAKYEAG
jgi:hypothetical protein